MRYTDTSMKENTDPAEVKVQYMVMELLYMSSERKTFQYFVLRQLAVHLEENVNWIPTSDDTQK